MPKDGSMGSLLLTIKTNVCLMEVTWERTIVSQHCKAGLPVLILMLVNYFHISN